MALGDNTHRDPREWTFAQRYYTPKLSMKQWQFAMFYCGEAGFDGPLAILMSYGNRKPHAADDEKVPQELRNTINWTTAKAMAHQNLAKTNIQECISDILRITTMKPEEVLSRITKMGRADVGDLIDIDPASNKPVLNLLKAKQKGALFLIKEIKYDTFGNVKSVVMHDSFAALVKLGQHHRLFDRQQERPLDPRDEARALLSELRDKHGSEFSDEILVAKVVERYQDRGVTSHDLVEDATSESNYSM